GDKRESERKERHHFHVRSGIDELWKKREKEECDFRIQDVGQDSLSKRGRACAPAEIRWQIQLFFAIEQHFDPEKNQISAAEQFDCPKGEGRRGENCRQSQRCRAGVKNTSQRNPERGSNARFAALRDASPQNVDRVRTRREVQ